MIFFRIFNENLRYFFQVEPSNPLALMQKFEKDYLQAVENKKETISAKMQKLSIAPIVVFLILNLKIIS